MFGYVRVPLAELPAEETERFRAAYCGLCHVLGQRYGAAARFILNYDFTFLAVLLGGESKNCRVCRRCAVRPFEKRNVLCANEAMHIAADESVILAYWKVKDEICDGGFFKGLKYRAALAALQRSYEKARVLRPGFDEVAQRELSRLRKMEQENCPSIDLPADAFANILSAAAEEVEEEAKRRILRETLYQLGRWVYLVDAADDLKEDSKSGNYNPLILRYGLQGGEFTEEAQKEFITPLDHSARLAASGAALLDVGEWNNIVESTLNRGLFYVAAQVLNGTYQKISKSKITRIRNERPL